MNAIQMPPSQLPPRISNEAEGDQQEREHVADGGGPARRLSPVAGDRPDDRAKHAPAVEREAGQQVEEREREVDGREIREQRGRDSPARRQAREDEEHAGQDQARQWPDEGDPELISRRRGLLLDAADASKDEEGDAPDRQATTLGDDRVAELVDEHGEEQQKRGCGAEPPVHRRGQTRQDGGEVPDCEAEGDQSEDEEPGVVDADLDSGDPADHERAGH